MLFATIAGKVYNNPFYLKENYMTSGVYERNENHFKILFQKGRTPHNKGEKEKSFLKKLAKFQSGEPITCKKHGEHLSWRVHSVNNVQCKLCSTEWQRIRKRKNPLTEILKDAKQHAKKGNREFNIDIHYLTQVRDNQKNCCALTDDKFTEDNLPSMDRINSDKGYIEGNIQLICIDINRMKTNFDQDYFISLCEKVYKHMIKKITK